MSTGPSTSDELELVPRIILPTERYYSAEKTRELGVEILGPEFTHNGLATVLGIHRKTLAYLLDGQHSPTLENYLRMCAEARIPMTRLLEGIGPRAGK